MLRLTRTRNAANLVACLASGALLISLATPATAHSFGRVYNLPVPVWLYLYGAAAALVLSFLVAIFFLQPSPATVNKSPPQRKVTHKRLFGVVSTRYVLALAKLITIALLALCIVSGFIGTHDPYKNINMSLFWIIFILGFTWLVALIGDIYAAINPWRSLCDTYTWLFQSLLSRFKSNAKKDTAIEQAPRLFRLRYPSWLSYWPSLCLYIAFIWLELFQYNTPLSLSKLLLYYTAYNLIGAALFGRYIWFKYFEWFGAFYHLVGKMGVLDIQAYKPSLIRLPFSGCIEKAYGGISALLFILFMLSSTAFDGLHETTVWLRIFWLDFYQLIAPWVGEVPLQAYPTMRGLLPYWQAAWLVLSPFIYLLFYIVAITLMRHVTLPMNKRASNKIAIPSTYELATRFAYSLLPIALVYHITHYYTLIQTQGIKVIAMASDPFSKGWNLFGTAGWFRGSDLPNPETVWHVQVGLIVLGHVISVVLAHKVALSIFQNRRIAAISQIPMLILMVAFTTIGLWILSEPIKPPV